MYGISSFCLHSLPLAEALEQLVPLTGYIEVMDEGLHRLDTAELLQSFSCRFSIHAPSRGTNLASLLEPIRRASVEVMADCFSVAAEVGAGVVLHPGYFAWEEEREKAWQQLGRSLADLHIHAQERSVDFFVENMGNWDYFLLKTPGEFSRIGAASFALDVGHAHQNHCLDGFLRLPARHYHLHDNDGTEDSHAAIGDGTIDFGAVMDVVNRSGIDPIIEVTDLPGVKTSIERLMAYK